MALSAKLQIRQSQSLVMTPQLLQSIRLLQYSNTELQAFVDSQMECNPLLAQGAAAGSDGSLPVADGASRAAGGQSAAATSPGRGGRSVSVSAASVIALPVLGRFR